ncbi:MAG: Re/Si-specific NAD(P)(+) transhydrogenase subunit alpha [Gemmatimonadetes bacterium]|nr:MAG: Re/Si-specific NAD(P)(+) transhydrogenase subunit alpha [Gemmatimonadota bacterium]
MKIGVPKETAANERRVALVPDTVGRLVKAGLEVAVEQGAGAAAAFPDDAYRAAGAGVVAPTADVFGRSDVVLKVQPPSTAEVALCREGAALVAVFQPAAERDVVAALAGRRVTAFSLALLPRITRAQPMDVLSSQATVAGYKAVLIAATTAGRLFPMLVTAAGTLSPARVLVLGAGVAGLQAIATARRLGAVVSAFDVRPAVKEQVESLGAKFLQLEIGEQAEAAGGYAKQLSEETHRRELAFIAQHVKDTDVVITTAAIPGKRAPILITADAVRGMKPGAVIVDLAAETGGNCEVTEPGTEVRLAGVVVLGPLNLPSTLPLHASQMYAKNISSFLLHVTRDGALVVDFDDEIIRETCVTHAGEVRKT